MPDPFRKVVPGDDVFPIPATVWNAFVEAAQRFKGESQNEGANALSQFRQGDIVKVKNETGVDLDRRQIVGLGDPIFTPSASLDAFLRAVTFRGVVPTIHHAGKFGVLLEPAPQNQVVRAFVAGVVQVQISMTGDDRAEASVGDTAKLVGTPNGSAQILWQAGGSGTQWCVIRFGPACGADAYYY